MPAGRNMSDSQTARLNYSIPIMASIAGYFDPTTRMDQFSPLLTAREGLSLGVDAHLLHLVLTTRVKGRSLAS